MGLRDLLDNCSWYDKPQFSRYNPSNMSDLDFDISRSPKVKCDSVIGLPISGFLLVSK